MTVVEDVREQLRQELEPLSDHPFAFVHEPTPIAGGFSSELFGFQLTHAPPRLGGPMVLRLLDDDRAAAREQQVHLGVAELGMTTPAVALVGDSSSAFGRPFTIMERLDGAPAVELRGLRAMRASRDAPVFVADSMVELHELDASPVVARLVRHGIGEEELGIDGTLAAIESEVEHPESKEALERLRATRPREGRPVVVHGDLHVLNQWRLPNGSIALLDWEVATIGPAELDLARSVLMFRLVPGEIPRAVRPVLMRLGRRAADAFTKSYAARRPYDDGALRWCCALHALRLLTVVLARPESNRVAAQWAPCGRQLATVVEQVTDVRVPVP